MRPSSPLIADVTVRVKLTETIPIMLKIAVANTAISTHTCGSVNAITLLLSIGTPRNARHPR